MRTILLIVATLTVLLVACPAAKAAEALPVNVPLAFAFSHADSEKAKTEQLPYFRVFPDGKDKDGLNANGSLRTLKRARGQSRLYKDEDAKPGLIVVFRRLVLVPQETGNYLAYLEGEFNASKALLKKETMEKLFAGERTELVFESETTKGVRPVAFTVKAKTTFIAEMKDGVLSFFGGKGFSTITHYALTGTYTYESDPVDLGDENNTTPVYIGRPEKVVLKSDGKPETLPVLNP
jgi:hypothetical protein